MGLFAYCLFGLQIRFIGRQQKQRKSWEERRWIYQNVSECKKKEKRVEKNNLITTSWITSTFFFSFQKTLSYGTSRYILKKGEKGSKQNRGKETKKKATTATKRNWTAIKIKKA